MYLHWDLTGKLMEARLSDAGTSTSIFAGMKIPRFLYVRFFIARPKRAFWPFGSSV